MKRFTLIETMLIVVIALILSVALATPGFAQGIAVKAAVTYNLDSNHAAEAVGGAATDVFGLKGVDIDLLIESEMGETYTTDEKKVILGGSWNYAFTENFSLGIGAGANIIDFSNGEVDILDEIDKRVYAAASWKW